QPDFAGSTGKDEPSTRKDSGGITNGQVARGDVLGYNRTSADYGPVANSYSFQNNSARTNEDTATDFDGLGFEGCVGCPTPLPVGQVKIVVEDHRSRAQDGSFPDFD